MKIKVIETPLLIE